MLQFEKHPSGKTIIFNDDKHYYTIKEDDTAFLISSTTFINKFFTPFKAQKIAKTYARNRGLNWKHVKAGWELKGKQSSALGNLCHNYVDASIRKTQLPTSEDKDIQLRLKFLRQKLKTLFKTYSNIQTEKIVLDINSNIAGTVDIILETDDHILIGDWKTNEKIPTIGFNKRTCYKPINYLQDCLFTKYALQVSLYKYIYQTNNYTKKPIKTIIYHVTPYGIIDMPIVGYDEAVKKIVQTRITV